MNRRKFVGIAGGTIIMAGSTYYLLGDKSNFTRGDISPVTDNLEIPKPDEKWILFLASLAPSDYNTQPWFVKYLEPYHWLIGNDKS